ncbi:MAG: class I SAM-dependent methyltransferase [Elusimicrobia bacterium]|nr:class I SAM-dependent methyltransferase [Elusimicrobiota bacterium]
MVAKALTPYARRFLFMTRALESARIDHPALPPIRVSDDRVLEYPYEELRPVRPYPSELLRALAEVASLQQALIPRNLVLWDLGGLELNYMWGRDGRLRWVDFGGNALLFVSPPQGVPPSPRENLVAAKNRFIQLSLLIHLAVFGLGRRALLAWGSAIQDDSSSFDRAEKEALAALRGTPFEAVGTAALANDLRTVEGWRALRRSLESALDSLEDDPPALEPADVSSVRRDGPVYQVRGYQNFDVGPDSIRALEAGHEWAPSYRKWKAVDAVLSRLGVSEYLDIGSNMGMHVFSAAIRQKARAHGVDYNPEYVRRCSEINERLGLGCRFELRRYSELEGRYQCVSLLGVIHHLYHRTEEYGDLEPIVLKLASLCSAYAIVEFPTGDDRKARQWTGMPGRPQSRPYDLERFLGAAKTLFPKIEKIGEAASDRPLFLLTRGGDAA